MSKIVKLERYAGNPIIAANPKCDWENQCAFNPGAIMHEGKVHILYRAAGKNPKTPGARFYEARIGLAISENGYDVTYRHPDPVIEWDADEGKRLGLFGINGVEDPRITKIEDTYYIVYTVTSACWDRLALASTKDFKIFKKHGLIVGDIAQRTGALFPDKIDGKFFLMHRPIPNIWVSESRDMKSFTKPKMILTNKVLPWCEMKLGVCNPPIRTKNAWAVIFHGRDRWNTYRLGIFWLDLNDPTKVLRIQSEPIMEPEADYELKDGITSNCIYACGAVEKDGKLLVYYGACDQYTCVATVPIENIEL
jgi:beta-1,2-mannobiose phosphorylase / 1,2-beta-oligomannan phosphorylase